MTFRQQLAATIAERTLTVKDSKQLSKEIAAYLMSEHQTEDLNSIIRDVIAYRNEKGYIEANVLSAYPISSDVRMDIKKYIHDLYPNAKHVMLNEVVDPSLVGGVRLEVGDRQLDFTVRAKLNSLKRMTAARKDI